MDNVIQRIRTAVRHWYIPLIVGVAFIAVGIYTFSVPATAYLTLAILFSLSFLFTGIGEVGFALANKDILPNWGWLLAFGLFNSLIGILLLLNPGLSMATLPLYIGMVVLIRSIGTIGYAMDLKRHGLTDWTSVLVLGIVGVLFAFILIYDPLLTGMTLVAWTAFTLIVFGAFHVFVSLKLRKLHTLGRD